MRVTIHRPITRSHRAAHIGDRITYPIILQAFLALAAVPRELLAAATHVPTAIGTSAALSQ